MRGWEQADNIVMPAVWRTYYGARGIRAAWLIILFCTPMFTLWVLGVATQRSLSSFSFTLYLTIFVAAGVFVWRHANERVETHPSGIVIVNTWRTHRLRWEDIAGLVTKHRYVVVEDRKGNLYPSPDQWMNMVQKDETLMLFDMVRGPQEIVGIEITCVDGRRVKVDAISRRILKAISDGSSTYRSESPLSNLNDDIL